MTSHANKPILVVALCCLCLLLFNVRVAADLTATVTPGYSFGPGERPTTATLNLLASPTITISGSAGGSNAAIALKSISGNMLTNTIVDNATIEFNGSVPRALRVLAAGIGVNQISSAIAGPGLIGGSGGALSNNVDGVRIVITNDVVTLATNLPLSYTAAASNTVFTGSTGGVVQATAPLPMYTNLISQVTFTTSVACAGITAGGKYIDTPHGFGARPTSLRAALVCTTDDVGYVVGDEVEASTAMMYYPTLAAEYPWMQFGAVWCNATNVGWTATLWPGGIAGSVYVKPSNRTTGGFASAITPANWVLKIYARP